jgi:hypothetical protein
MINQEQTSLSWLDEEINSSVFSDRRRASRFKSLMQKLWRGMGNSLPLPARIMQQQKPLTGSFPVTGLMSSTCCRDIPRLPVKGYMRCKVRRFYCFRTPQHLATTGITLMQ